MHALKCIKDVVEFLKIRNKPYLRKYMQICFIHLLSFTSVDKSVGLNGNHWFWRTQTSNKSVG